MEPLLDDGSAEAIIAAEDFTEDFIVVPEDSGGVGMTGVHLHFMAL